MPILHKLLYTFHMILIEIQIGLFTELRLISKFTCKSKHPRIIKEIWKRRSKGAVYLKRKKRYDKATITEAVWYRCRNKAVTPGAE